MQGTLMRPVVTQSHEVIKNLIFVSVFLTNMWVQGNWKDNIIIIIITN